MLQLPIYQSQSINRFSPLEFLGSFINFTPELIWLAVGLVGLFFIIFSFILSYHWKKFGLDTFVMAKAAVLYFSVSAILLGTMTISLVVYLNSL
ncbi:MAG: hypothetical protein A3J46_04480 [Candidatus Yanofskybacteria bacterium RIFCSPHIGHO2_02_FULL_41_11]|uniref:DUF5658 domain-containing protein n=1 Tax=Candidatus Yanofskybacteria bacterium RIFCSPHIGHO2_02_FULL_41_11 TaxID=1802675 RepID=A0A1F8FBM3_9BACT|nr:MAG: hypothetical protein A3J46_04480 [Candidatus Yanofskybacteria bacterium RIFCSPHIGHO2_02_FULL_41_11]